MILEVKAKHFKGVEYSPSASCPLARAAKEQFKEEKVFEEVDLIRIGKKIYYHLWYSDNIFNKDKKKAKELRYSNNVIRRIRLTILPKKI